MFRRPSQALAAAALALMMTAAGVAAQEPEKEPFTDERFAALQEAGAVILLDVFADWCPTCAGQLILYRGTEQLWFSIAETRQEKIFAALDEALR